MNAHQSGTPTKAELQAYSLGKLDPERVEVVEAYVADHPECLADLASANDDVVRHLRGAGDVPAPPRRPSLLELAVEAVLPVVAGCAGALAGGVEGGLVGVVVGQAAEKAINFFGSRIVTRWLEWLRGQPPAAQSAALAELADVPLEVARSQVAAVLASRAPQASEADRRAAADYLGAIPHAVRQSLLSDRVGGRTLMPSVSVDDSLSLLQLLPASLPPYAAPCVLPGTAYQLEELIGSGGFGAVYRATNPDMKYLPLAIKFCHDRSMLPVLRREQANLERLIEAGGTSWSPRIVRLYGYNLEHQTPYLLYEYVCGGDLVSWLARRRASTDKGPASSEVFALIVQVVEALAFAHERGIVHRDLKPANVLMDERGKVKLADFGIGGMAQQTEQVLRSSVAPSSAAEQLSLFRGAGTPLYVDPEQREGKAADPRHDLYSLGVTWYQLLVGDVRRELRHGWERELERGFGVPHEHVALIGRCVEWIEERPRNAAELLKLMPVVEESKPAADIAPIVEAQKLTSSAEAAPWRDRVVRAIFEAENCQGPDFWGGAFVISAMVCAALALVSIVRAAWLANEVPGWITIVAPGCLAVALTVVGVVWVTRVSRPKRLRAQRKVVSVVRAARAALSLPETSLDADDHKSLCETAWNSVGEIEARYLARNARVRITFPGASLVPAMILATVEINGRRLGGGDVDTSVDLCCGCHLLAVRLSGTLAGKFRTGIMVIPEEGSYHAEVRLGSMLRVKVDRSN